MNALELAADLESVGVYTDAAAMLRRQHEAIQKLREALRSCVGVIPVMYCAHRDAQKALKDTEDLK